jgi:hypothetical protein
VLLLRNRLVFVAKQAPYDNNNKRSKEMGKVRQRFLTEKEKQLIRELAQQGLTMGQISKRTFGYYHNDPKSTYGRLILEALQPERKVHKMIHWALFETRIGNWALTVFERLTGLGVVPLSQITRITPKN